MAVVLTGRDLTLVDVVRVARERTPVVLDPEALHRMEAARRVADRVIAEGGVAYGLTTGVGVHKQASIEDADHDRVVLGQHLMGHGPLAPVDVVRAMTLRLANALAQGTTVARPELAERVVEALNVDELPPVRARGSIGESDLSAMADLVVGVLGDTKLAQGESIALLNQNALSTGWGALALHDAVTLLDTLDVGGALDFEALGANRSVLDRAIGDVRPYPGLRSTLERLGALLEGGDDGARELQDPLSFRTLPQVHGATRDAFGFALGQLAVELNAAQSNPLVETRRGAIFSVGNFEVLPLAAALDIARIALAPALTSACERTVKLLQASVTGLPEGLGARANLAESALSELGIAVQALTAEACLLAQPVSFVSVSTTQAEGLEDRMTMAPLAARRLAEMVELGQGTVAVGLLVAAQACDLRGVVLGGGTGRAHASIRRFVPFVAEGDALPDLEPLVAHVREGGLAAP